MRRATRTALTRAELTWPEAAWSVVNDDFDIRLRARVATPDGDLHFEAWQVEGNWRASLVLVFCLPRGEELAIRCEPFVCARLLRSAIHIARDAAAVNHARALLSTLDDSMVALAGAEAVERARAALSGVVEAGGIRATAPAEPAADGGAP